MTLAGVGMPPAKRHICDVVIRSKIPNSGFFPKTVLVSGNAPDVTRRDRWADQQTDHQQVQDWQILKASDKHGHQDI